MFDLFGKKAAARYQLHKDALESGAKLLAKYTTGEDREEFNAIALEYRRHVSGRLQTIKGNIEVTRVPADLGDAELLKELLEDVTWVQMATTGQVPAQGRETMRAVTFTMIFRELEGYTKDVEDDGPAWGADERLKGTLLYAKEAREWFQPGDRHEQLKVSPTDAAKIYDRALAAVAKLKV